MQRSGVGIVLALLLLAGPVGAKPPTGLQTLRDLGAVRPKMPWVWLKVINGDADNEASMIRQWRGMEELYGDEEAWAASRAVLLIDRAKGFDTRYGDWTGARVYEVLPDKDRLALDSNQIADCGELNMSDPRTLQHFLAGAIKSFPADHYLLSISTHGAGWATFLSDADAPGADGGQDRGTILTLREGLRAGLRDAGRDRLDVLSIDSCLMGQLDLAVACKDLADVILFSEAVSSDTPASEEWFRFGVLQEKDDLRQIAFATISGVGASLRFWGSKSGLNMQTRSAIDCRKLDAMLAALDALIGSLLQTAERDWPLYARAILGAEAYVPPDDLTRGKQARASFDLIDIMERIRLNVPGFGAEAEYQAFRKAADDCIIHQYVGRQRSRSHGIAIYAPIRPGMLNPEYAKTPLARTSAWPRLLGAIHQYQQRPVARPRFDNVQLVDARGRPSRSLAPLAGARAHCVLTAENLLALNFAVGVPREKADVLLLKTSFAPPPDPKRARGLTPQEVRLLLPAFRNGSTPFAQHLGGVLFQWGGAPPDKLVYVSIETLSEEAPTVTTKGRLRQPKDKKFEKVVVHFDRESWEYADIERHLFDDKGNAIGVQHFLPHEDAIFKPLLDAVTADGKHHEFEYGETKWGKHPRLILGLAPPGDQVLYLDAHTVSGERGVARVPYHMASDPTLQPFAEGKVRVHPASIQGSWRLESVTADASTGQASPRDTGVRLTFTHQEMPWPNLLCHQTVGGKARERAAHFEPEGLPTLSLYDEAEPERWIRAELFVALPQQARAGTRPAFVLRDMATHAVYRLVPAAEAPTPAPDGLVGTWVSDEGITLHLTRDRYRLLEKDKQTDAGTYRVNGAQLVITNDTGDVETVAWFLDGDRLRITDEDGTVYALHRSKEE